MTHAFSTCNDIMVCNISFTPHDVRLILAGGAEMYVYAESITMTTATTTMAVAVALSFCHHHHRSVREHSHQQLTTSRTIFTGNRIVFKNVIKSSSILM